MPLTCCIYSTLLEEIVLLYGFVNYFISFEYQWNYIFRNKLWFTLSGILLSLLLFHKMTLLNRDIFWVSSLHLWILYHYILPLQCHFQKFAGVAMKCTLHCHSILTTPLPLWSGIAVLICIFGTHSNDTSVAHSIATPTPLPKYTPTPLRSAHSIATPLLPLQCHSQSTLQCHSGVSLEC